MKNLVYDIINPSNNIWLDPSQRLEAGDRILYVSSNESIRLIVDHEASYESCNGCYFGNAILCSVPDRLNCLEYGVIFKLMDTNDMLMTNEFSIELSSIKGHFVMKIHAHIIVMNALTFIQEEMRIIV